MKRAATILLLLSVISITLFGFNTMHASEHGNRCLASAFTASEPPCPQTNIISFIGYHLDVFKVFSLATLIVASSLFIVFALWSISIVQPLIPAFAYSRRRVTSIPQQFRTASEWRWYSLHEHSPACRIGRS